MNKPGAVLERKPEKPPVDPRLRARRIEVRRRQGRRRLMRLLALLVLTVLCAGAWGLSRSALFDVDHIEISGIRRADAAVVEATSGIQRGDALIDLDLDAARSAIAGLGWVESVEVSHTWRGTVHVKIRERTPVATLAAADGSRWLVDSRALVIDRAAPSDIATLPLVSGLEVPTPGSILAPAKRPAVQTAMGLTAGLAAWVDEIVVDDGGEVWLSLKAPSGSDYTLVNARARLGDSRDLEAQLLAVETVLARVDLQCLAVIDARVGSAPVVTRHESCEGI